jgi:hypothetical protein
VKTVIRIVTGQVRGQSSDGKDAQTDSIAVGGFIAGTVAHVVLTGWSFKFSYGDHPILEMGIWLQKAITGGGGWDWCLGVPVDHNGNVEARYYAFAGSENRDNPFTFLVNYAVIGEVPAPPE